MLSDLIDRLNQLPDPRRRAGLRHPIGLVLVLAIMATVAGMGGYRAMGDFVRANGQELAERLGVARLPSYSTIRRVPVGLPTQELSRVLCAWSPPGPGDPVRWVHIDGKAIKGTVEDQAESNQDFVNVVSLFFAPQRLVVGSAGFRNKEESEIKVVRDVLEDFGFEGVVFTADALHAQKKRSA